MTLPSRPLVLHAANAHRGTWGSDHAWAKTIDISRAHGIDVRVFARDSGTLSGLPGRVRAFTDGIYAAGAVREFDRAIAALRPDIVHTHELYPLISPWILPRCTAAGIPVVHTCYDYRLTCPIATHYTRNQVCRRCEGGHEHWAVLRNCRDNLAESAAYALRNAVARRFRLYTRHVSRFVVLTEFGRDWLLRLGIPADRVTVQPCVIPVTAPPVDPAGGGYVAYAGRFAPEKGVDVLIKAARLANLPVRLAANAPGHPGIRAGDPVECVLTDGPDGLAAFYRGARMLVVPSLWEETFGIVAGEAMSHGVPVIASRIGALQHTVTHETTGLLVAPGDPAALAAAMRRLWDDPALCRRLGAAARARVEAEFSEAAHIRVLRDAYGRAAEAPAAGRLVAA